MKNHIVLTGATGNTGQIIAQELKKRGVPFITMARSGKNRARLLSAGMEAVHGDFDDPASMVRALDGAEKAYLCCTPDHNLGPRETAFISAAKKAGVRHIVKCSAYAAGVDSWSGNLRSHGRVERALIDSGMEYTILRPHGFMQTFTLFTWDMVQKAGVVSAPHGDGAMPLIDIRDVAAVGVKALTERGHANKAYDLTGPEALNYYQVAEILSRALGKRVTYLPGAEGPFLAMMIVLGVPAAPREHVAQVARKARARELEKVHPTLQELGIKPVAYEQFVSDLLAGRTGGGNSFPQPDTLVTRMLGAVMPVMMRLMLRMRGR